MNLIITMAGRGLRLREKFVQPKPFIRIAGIPALAWSMAGLQLNKYERIIFVTTDEIVQFQDPRSILSEYFPHTDVSNSTVVILNDTPPGQALTAQEGLKAIGFGEAFVISNCDTFYSDHGLFSSDFQNVSGIVGYFGSNSPNYSYIKFDANGDAIELAEKIVISNNASTGLYYFRSREDFDFCMAQRVENRQEMYVAPLYNHLIQRGDRVTGFQSNFFYPLGTINEIESFQNSVAGRFRKTLGQKFGWVEN